MPEGGFGSALLLTYICALRGSTSADIPLADESPIWSLGARRLRLLRKHRHRRRIGARFDDRLARAFGAGNGFVAATRDKSRLGRATRAQKRGRTASD